MTIRAASNTALATGAVVYEVNLLIEVAIFDAYRAWLSSHVDEMLGLPGFVDACVMDVLEPTPASGHVALCVHYQLHDRAALDDYLRVHAMRMRAAAHARFGNGFSAHRRILGVADAVR